MVHIYSFPSPKGLKVAMMAAECGIECDMHQVDILTGEQFQRHFSRLAPTTRSWQWWMKTREAGRSAALNPGPLSTLTGGYRGAPVMQIGADI